MKKPVNIHIPDEYQESTQFFEQVPSHAHYRIDYTQCNYWRHTQFSIIEQYYDGKDVYSCLAEVNAKICIDIPIVCERYDFYWLYQLRGAYEIRNHNDPKELIFPLVANQYAIVSMPQGIYLTRFKPGKHLLCYFVISRNWLLRHQRGGLEPIKQYVAESLTLKQLMNSNGIVLLSINFKIRSLLLQLFHIQKTIPILQDVEVYQYTIALLRQSLAALASKKEKPSGEQTTLIDHVRAFISERIQQGNVPTIDSLAQHFNVSVSYLWYQHKRDYGIPLNEFIKIERLAYAQQLLSSTQLSVKEVAFKIGYSEGTNFSKVFKRHFGVSPAAFRKTITKVSGGNQS